MSWQKICKGAYQTDGKKYRFIVRKTTCANGDTDWVVTAAELQTVSGVRHTIGVQETGTIGTEGTLAEAKEIVGIILDTEVPAFNLHYEFRDAYLSDAYAEGSK